MIYYANNIFYTIVSISDGISCIRIISKIDSFLIQLKKIFRQKILYSVMIFTTT